MNEFISSSIIKMWQNLIGATLNIIVLVFVEYLQFCSIIIFSPTRSRKNTIGKPDGIEPTESIDGVNNEQQPAQSINPQNTIALY